MTRSELRVAERARILRHTADAGGRDEASGRLQTEEAVTLLQWSGAQQAAGDGRRS